MAFDRREWQRKRWADAAAAGLCGRCRLTPHEPDRVLCTSCRLDSVERQRVIDQRKRDARPAAWCDDCGTANGHRTGCPIGASTVPKRRGRPPGAAGSTRSPWRRMWSAGVPDRGKPDR